MSIVLSGIEGFALVYIDEVFLRDPEENFWHFQVVFEELRLERWVEIKITEMSVFLALLSIEKG